MIYSLLNFVYIFQLVPILGSLAANRLSEILAKLTR